MWQNSAEVHKSFCRSNLSWSKVRLSFVALSRFFDEIRIWVFFSCREQTGKLRSRCFSWQLIRSRDFVVTYERSFRTKFFCLLVVVVVVVVVLVQMTSWHDHSNFYVNSSSFFWHQEDASMSNLTLGLRGPISFRDIVSLVIGNCCCGNFTLACVWHKVPGYFSWEKPNQSNISL